MNKKIMAIALAMVFIATAFTACKKELETMKINGGEYPVYRDDKGELVINEENKIAVLVTDRQNQEVVTEEGGEPQTYWVYMNKDTVGDGYIQGKDYTLNVPDGWEGSEKGRVFKKRTDEKCYIEFRYLAKLKSGETLESILEKQDETNETIAEALKDEAQMKALMEKTPEQAEAIKSFIGSECTFEKKTATISKDNIPCTVRVTKIVNASGKLVQYAEDYYFVHNGMLYMVKYTCLEGVGYDETFDFGQYLKNGFTFRPNDKTETTTKAK